MTEFDVIVPHKNMSSERATECYQIMAKGNAAFRRWLPFISQRRSKSCRRAVIKGEMNEVLQHIPSERRVEFLADVPAILAVEGVVMDVVGHHVKMIVRLARRWADNNHNNGCSVRKSYIDGGDIASEGFLAMFDAIHNYDRLDIRFLTYAWSTVNRRMFAAIMETAPIACFNRREQKLLQKVVKDQLKSGRKKSLAQAVSEGVVSDEEAEVVREILTVKVVLASKLEERFGAGMGESDVFDYTSLRSGVMDDNRDQPNDSWELYEFIQKAGLSDFEQDALLSSMTPFFGWQVECAKRHKHPLTQEPITRAAVGIALARACSKIRKVAGLAEAKINIAAAMVEAMAGD